MHPGANMTQPQDWTATLAEPHELDDDRVLAAFHKFKPRKIHELHWEGIEASVPWGIG